MNEKDSPGDHEKAIWRILHYLIEHPDAKDTIKGILKWWLPPGQAEWRKGEVQKALDVMTSKGWLTTRETTPSNKIYRLNKDQLQEIKNLLNCFWAEDR